MSDSTLRLPLLGEPEPSAPIRRAPPWLRMGFRPFFLAAAIHAGLAVPWWLHALGAAAAPAAGERPAVWWHAHEMLFGFTLAVIAGFLLTAVRNWTGRDTAHGRALAGLLALWVAGRAVMAAQASLPPWVVALVDLAFPVALLLVLARPVIAARNWRNLGILALLSLLTLSDALIHARFAAGDAAGGRAALLATVHFVVLLNVVVGGRVIGMFTWVATGRQPLKRRPVLDGVAVGTTAGVALAAAIGHSGAWFAGCLAVAGFANLLRMRQWTVREVLRIPMVLVLHVGYAWIGVGQLLLAATRAGLPVAESTALHALTIGVIGTMTLGMMVRVSLGHTGRPMRPSPLVRLAIALMFAAPLARLSSLLLPSSAWNATVQLAGALFASAFLLFLVAFVPILLGPRADGRRE